jgi:hypothetical protein
LPSAARLYQVMAFERPIKGDLDRALSLLMHEHRHRLTDQVNNIKADAIKAGSLQSNRLVITCAKAADALHQEAMKQAASILLDFIERMQLTPIQITDWARPHLENLGNSLLGVVPPNGFAADHQRIRKQYDAVFSQRLSGVLRDVEIGFVKGEGFAGARKMEAEEEWVTAAEAVALLKSISGTAYTAQMTICKRAHAGLIRAIAAQLIVGDGKAREDVEIPRNFWWAEGAAALTQNWELGDFETWIKDETRIRVFGAKFARADIQKLIPTPSPPTSERTLDAKGGRPPAEYWDDLWVEICRQLHFGELVPKRQGDIEDAMKTWLATERDEHPSTSTIRPRARKLWNAIKGEN